MQVTSMSIATDDIAALRGSTRFRQHQRAHQLVDDLLRPRIAGRHVPSARFHVHDADAYSATPAELARAHEPVPEPRPTWFFLTPPHYHGGCRCRRVGCAAGGKGVEGYWKMQNGHRYKHVETDGGVFYLYVRNYIYMDRSTAAAAAVTRRYPEWVMVEYGIVREEYHQEELVLCEMYRTKARRAGLL